MMPILHVTQLDQSLHALLESNYALQLSSVISGASNKHHIKKLGA